MFVLLCIYFDENICFIYLKINKARQYYNPFLSASTLTSSQNSLQLILSKIPDFPAVIFLNKESGILS